jgi:hypothetical protein
MLRKNFWFLQNLPSMAGRVIALFLSETVAFLNLNLLNFTATKGNIFFIYCIDSMLNLQKQQPSSPYFPQKLKY